MWLDPGTLFRGYIYNPPPKGYVFGFGVGTALGARVSTMAGAQVTYAGGWSIAASLGLPDLGLVTMSEQLMIMRHIVRNTRNPVIADIDDGYGAATNVDRTVASFFSIAERNFETGDVHRLAAVHMEDQVLPKRCGHIAGKELVSVPKMVGKMKAACRARDQVYPEGFIIARTDAFNSKVPGSMQEAINRASAYADAGADLAWCEFNGCEIKLAADFAEGVKKRHPNLPLAFNYSPSLPWRDEDNPNLRLTFEQLGKLGYRFIFVTIAEHHAHTFSVYNYAKRFEMVNEQALWEMQKSKGVGRTTTHPLEQKHPTGDHQALMGVHAYQAFERDFVPGAAERQDTGEGFKH